MTHACCPSCRLRFTRAASAHLAACPACGEPPEPILSAERVIGFRLASDEGRFDDLPVAVAFALPIPPSEERSE